MSELTIIVPTRGRPNNLAALWTAFAETCTGDTVLLACVDEDDPELPAYRDIHEAAYEAGTADRRDPRFRLLVGPRLRLGGTLNAVAPYQASMSPYVGFMGDDHRPRTVGWDTRYMAALDRLGTGIVYGNDLIQGQALPTQMAMTSDIVLALGYMVPRGLIHLYLDDSWLALGNGLGRITYLPDVIVEHLHPIAGKSEWDAGYAECNSDEVSSADQARFVDWRNNELPGELAKLREVIG